MEKFHLTIPQKNVWNLQRYYEGTSVINLCGAIFYREYRTADQMRESIRGIIRNQNGFRLRFENGEEVLQYVAEDEEIVIPELLFETEEELDHYAEICAKEPIGLTDGAMYRFYVFHAGDKSGILVVLSHLIADGWSIGLIAKQGEEVYHKWFIDSEVLLTEGNYIDFIHAEEAYLESPKFEKDRLYWEEKYAKQPEETPVKLLPAVQESIEADRLVRTVPEELEKKMRTFSAEHGITPAVLFETALISYLHRLNPENRTATVGVPVLNRSNAKERRIVGMFIATLPMTIDVSGEMSVLELAEQIRKEHMSLFRHQKYPYQEILKYLREKQGFSGNLYDVMISYQNAATDTDAETRWYSNGYSEVPLVVHIDNRDGNECHTLNIDYQTAVFSEEEAGYFAERLLYILRQIVDMPDIVLSQIEIVPEREREILIHSFNDTYVDYPRGKCVHELFTEQAERTPDKTALVFEDKKFTYRELDEMSNSLAHLLREKGVGRGDVVPIIAKRSWHYVVATIAVLKAGGAFMPVSPEYPKERIQDMVADVEAKIVLIHADAIELGEDCKIQKLEDVDYGQCSESLESMNELEDDCYVIFTSGTTGKPKGTVICHQNLINFLDENEKNEYQTSVLKNCSVFLADISFTFDPHVFHVYLPLIHGMTEVLTSDNMSGDEIAELIELNHCDTMNCTPTRFQTYLQSKKFQTEVSKIKVLSLGAEVFTEKLRNECQRLTKAVMYNVYGPTETTIISTVKKVSGNNKTQNVDITIGRPIANTQIYILGPDSRLLPIGVAGELCIAGEGVGKGYLNRPELTAEKFVPNPFATEENHHGKTMYRTGDLARWRADGELEYLGRIDTQVKIRGLRIELGEIESVMASYPGIRLTAAADRRDAEGRQYLVGYYTAEGSVDERAMRQHLGAKLPKYMVPNYFVHLESMPMTASGKTDRKKLPTPEFTVQTTEYEAPATEKEEKLCHLLEHLFRMERIGTLEDFFDLGGDSLAAIDYVAKAHSQGIEFTLQNVFDYPTVRGLCTFLEMGRTENISYQPSDFEKYDELLSRNEIEEGFVPEKKPLGNVLLTGATGFLGAHVLEQLLKEESGTVYCLVRGQDEADAERRLRDTIAYYFDGKYEAEIGKRIVPVFGDITEEGLSEKLPCNVQTVIHTAASVKHYGSYEYFDRINVQGTGHVVEFAQKVGAKLFHVSTISVSGNSMADEFSVYRSETEKDFTEKDLYIEQPLDNVYIHSKFEAERRVFDAMLEGLDGAVIRVGNLTNRESDYRFQKNYQENAFLTRAKAVLEFGKFPDYVMPLYAEFSPIDRTAEGVVRIAQYAGGQNVFHLNSNRPIYFSRFLEVLHELGITMEVVDGEIFNRALQETIRKSGQEYIFKAFQNDMDENGRLVYDTNIRIRNEFTVWFLKQIGFEWEQIDTEYIEGYINYFRGLGYLKV